jgi:hypothetical protein
MRSRVLERVDLRPAVIFVFTVVILEVVELKTHVLDEIKCTKAVPEAVVDELPELSSQPVVPPEPPDTLTEPIVPFVEAYPVASIDPAPI